MTRTIPRQTESTMLVALPKDSTVDINDPDRGDRLTVATTTDSTNSAVISWTQRLSKFPEELRTKKAWCNWRLVQREEKKSTKVPYQPCGRPASSTNPATWVTFEEACSAADRDHAFGVGVFCDGTYTFIDFDHCVDPTGVIEPWALAALSRINSYSEFSPSGKGIHAFARGSTAKAAKINGCEIYSRARYFTVTGAALPDAPATIREMNEAELDELRQDIADDQLRPAQHNDVPLKPDRRPLIIERPMSHSEREAKLERALSGDLSQYGGDRSAAVFGALQLLARKHSGDEEKMREEFEASELCDSYGQKWKRLGDSEIAKARERWNENGRPIWADSKLSLPDALAQFNREYCYVNANHAIVQMSNRMVMRATDFRGAHASNRFATSSVMLEDGTTNGRKVPIAKAWLEWPRRRQVERMVYEPGKPEFFDNQLNRWRGWGCHPVPGDTQPWEKLLDSIFRGDAVARHWFEQWCAYPIQHPGAKLTHAVILFGAKQGTGKTTIGETLGRIYGTNFSVISEEQLHSSFNDWAADKQFILADEITGSGDKRKHADRLKLMVTSSTIHVNKKFEPEYTLRDSINYLFTSNHPNSFFLEDSDRRYFVWEANGPALTGDFFREYYRWLDDGGGSALFHRLLHLDLSGFQPHQAPPKTAAKAEVIELGWSELDRWIRQQIADPTKLIEKGGHVWTCAKLLKQFEWEPSEGGGITVRCASGVKEAGMAAALKRAGLTSRRVQIRGVVDAYCYAFGPGWDERDTRDWATEYSTRQTSRENTIVKSTEVTEADFGLLNLEPNTSPHHHAAG